MTAAAQGTVLRAAKAHHGHGLGAESVGHTHGRPFVGAAALVLELPYFSIGKRSVHRQAVFSFLFYGQK